jgi:hypothetical protein
MGDLNYRLREVSVDKALTCLAKCGRAALRTRVVSAIARARTRGARLHRGELDQLRERDELRQEILAGRAFSPFRGAGPLLAPASPPVCPHARTHVRPQSRSPRRTSGRRTRSARTANCRRSRTTGASQRDARSARCDALACVVSLSCSRCLWDPQGQRCLPRAVPRAVVQERQTQAARAGLLRPRASPLDARPGKAPAAAATADRALASPRLTSRALAGREAGG